MIRIILLCIISALLSCGSPERKVEDQTKIPVPKHDTLPEVALWADPLIEDYLNLHLDKLSASPNGPLTYIKEYGDWQGKQYLTVRIGQSFPDHYATLQWLFIDSTSKQVFEYDIPNDTLIEWVVD